MKFLDFSFPRFLKDQKRFPQICWVLKTLEKMFTDFQGFSNISKYCQGFESILNLNKTMSRLNRGSLSKLALHGSSNTFPFSRNPMQAYHHHHFFNKTSQKPLSQNQDGQKSWSQNLYSQKKLRQKIRIVKNLCQKNSDSDTLLLVRWPIDSA